MATLFAQDFLDFLAVDDLEQLVGILQGIVTIAAIVIGGIWAYLKYFRGRTFRPRLEPDISGVVVSHGGVSHLKVTASLKNVGLSKVDIEQKGSGLRVFSYDAAPHATEAHIAEWTRIRTFPVLEDHQWIEPGESIEDERLIVIPEDEHLAIQLELRVVSNGITWKERSIIDLAGEDRRGSGVQHPVAEEGGKE
jgi:hypothetical protein